MNHTEKLFYKDSHLRRFTAKVLECHRDEKGYQTILDRTAFFPEGGGQYADTGTLGGACVTDVQEKEGIIYHRTDEPFEAGTAVEGVIEWDTRFMKMQQHTGEHIVSGLIHERFGYDNVGFHLGTTDCTMDFNGDITPEQLREIERRANEAVVQNLDVETLYPSEEELADIIYRSKIEIEGQTRIVRISGYDTCACCAPHVKKTGEIGLVKLTDVQHYKGGVRVTMLCGFRALADYGRKAAAVKQISNALCAKPEEVAQAVEHLKEECGDLKQRLAQKQKEVLEYKAKEPEKTLETVCLFEESLEGEAPRILMNLVLEEGHKVCAVFCGSGKSAGEMCAYRYCIGSKSCDVRALGKALNERFAGKGGGRPEMVQGSLYGREEELRAWIQKESEELIR